MVRLDYLLLGYFEIEIFEADIWRAADLFFKNGVSLKLRVGNRIFAPARERSRIISILDGEIEYSVSEIKGMYGLWLRNSRRYGFFAAVFLSALLYLFLGCLVWDVRIEGCKSGREEEIIAELSECGLSVGTLWRNINKNEVETKALLLSDNISWLNINRRGTVAYVSVVDKVLHEEDPIPDGYANLVATRDCIIEEITVKRGVAVVKAGMSVKKGDLLISGVIPMQLGGGYCYADGVVVGRFSDGVTVEVGSYITEKVYSERTVQACSLKFFNFTINIFKRYGNLGETCDIIEETKPAVLPGGKKLPVSLTVKYAQNYTLKEQILSSDELVLLASERLRESILLYAKDKEILRMTTYGNFTENGYTMSTDIVCRGSVTEIGKFEVQTETK